MSNILELLKDMNKRLTRIERMLKKADNNEDQDVWLSEEETMQLLNLGKRSLFALRKSGKIEFKCRPGKRASNFKYSKTSIDGLYL